MNWRSRFRRRRRWEQQMDAEFRFHLESEIDKHLQRGFSREEAERREFGAIDLAKEECRDVRPTEWLERFLREIRQAARSLRKSPGFTIAAILTLALGIGANTAIFSVLYGVALSPLPYQDPDRLVVIALYNRSLHYTTYLSYPDFLDWQRASSTLQQLAAFIPEGFDLTSPGAPEHVAGKDISANFFSTLGEKLALGHDFSPEQDRFGGMPAAIISNRLWREIGIRIALGAEKRDVIRMILRQGLRLALAGIVIGAGAAFVVTRALPSFSRLLYGVRANDPLTLTVVSLLLLSTALVACYIPARRAARLQPMLALRNE